MFKRMLNIIMLSCFLLISGCAADFSKEFVTIHPQLTVSTINVGHGKSIFLNVVDVRIDDRIGGRTVNNYQPVEIHLTDGLTSSVSAELERGLSQIGFKLIGSNETATKLTVNIVAIQFRELDLKGNTVVTAVVEVIAEDRGKTYRKTYRTDDQYTDSFLANIFPSPQTSLVSERINAALSKSLSNLLTDKQLILVLTK